MKPDPRSRHPRKLANTVAKAFGLPQTASRIVEVLARTKEKLAVTQIVERVKRSERSVRQSLSVLIRKGILEREVTVTATKKLAYVYSLSPMDEIVHNAREELSKTVAKLEEVAKNLTRDPLPEES
jgi:predicted DNA-binding transcriptional regulator